jgi:two-component system chemotaxis response regulator CheY
MNGDADTPPMLLPEILDLAAADGFLATMRQRVADQQALRIDASAVETLTLPCIQIILAASACHGRISVQKPSAAFSAAFADLGLEPTWGLEPEHGEPAAPEAGEDSAQEPVQESVHEPLQEQSPEQSQSPVQDPPVQAAADGGAADQPGDREPQQTGESTMSKRILTIDDSKTMRDMLMLTLAEAGFDVLQAVDGQDGLDVLVNEQVDVVITDINMPRMDGYEVIRQLRSNPSHKTTPILVLTTESEAEKKNLARAAGATGWMVKPFDPDRLVATVRKVAP